MRKFYGKVYFQEAPTHTHIAIDFKIVNGSRVLMFCSDAGCVMWASEKPKRVHVGIFIRNF